MNKNKILVIDDEREFLDFLKEELELHGYDVIISFDGEEGFSRIKKAQPNIIICDIRMPKQDGFYVLKELRKSGDTITPFIMLTALTELEKAREAYTEEADLYMTKPVEIPLLLKNIEILLNLSKQKI